MNYRILKTLDLDGRRYFRGTDAELELPPELAADLKNQGVIRDLESAEVKPEKKAKN